ncbi:dnaJ homolog subfamily B member 14 [Eutrema salsugineum]|uniref:dnaJ homolog subfamily B member 14 n=1 Tax=Eutrema salsugineum TaxID=72664 RepID=UPI000CED7815|nr:dnaJ homolog subfamily B member 14 [Eutrema salsugineum]
MECNKVEARRAIIIAERNDYIGAKKFVNKAKNLYPELDGLKQISTMINVYISASNKINGEGEADWYGILGVDPLADDEAVKKQYKKLALLIHPDKNKFHGANEAFKLVSEAWCLLSDKTKRNAYDQKRKSKQVKQKKRGMQQKPPKRYEPEASSNKPKHEPEPGSSSKNEKAGMFMTKCNRCNTYCQFVRDSCLNITLPCPNCGQDFVAAEILPKIIDGRPVFGFSESTCDTSSSPWESDEAKAAYELRMKSWFEPEPEPEHGSSSKKQKV